MNHFANRAETVENECNHFSLGWSIATLWCIIKDVLPRDGS